MNTYKISFTRENGTQGTDHFTAATEAQARRAEMRAEELREKLVESEKDYEAAHAAAHEIADQKDREIAQLKNRLADKSRAEAACESCQNGLLKKAAEAERLAGEAERRAEAAEAEVIALKAKLYDFMVKNNAEDPNIISTSKGPWQCSIKVPKEDRARVEAAVMAAADKYHALAISIGLIPTTPGKLTLCLCSTCAENFYGSGAYFLRRVNPIEVEKELCT